MKAGKHQRRGCRVFVATSILPLVLLAAVVVSSTASLRLRQSSDSERRFSVTGVTVDPAPIPGIRATLAGAATTAPYPIPLLPAKQLEVPCLGVSAPLAPVDVWVSPPDTTPSQEIQVGVNFTHGIWMSLNPLSLEAITPVDGDLPHVADVFASFDTPDFVEGTVRGHRAWTRGFDPDLFTCPDPETVPVDGAVVYDPTTTANIQWLENDVVIEVAGPFPVEVLTELAQDIKWAGKVNPGPDTAP